MCRDWPKVFAKYELLTQRWPFYGRVYPPIEMLIALGFIWNTATGLTGSLAVFVGMAGIFSVYKAVVIDKPALNCACVGGNSKAPFGIVSFAENGMMALMGIAMFLGYSCFMGFRYELIVIGSCLADP
jgi:hypothetical protein